MAKSTSSSGISGVKAKIVRYWNQLPASEGSSYKSGDSTQALPESTRESSPGDDKSDHEFIRIRRRRKERTSSTHSSKDCPSDYGLKTNKFKQPIDVVEHEVMREEYLELIHGVQPTRKEKDEWLEKGYNSESSVKERTGYWANNVNVLTQRRIDALYVGNKLPGSDNNDEDECTGYSAARLPLFSDPNSYLCSNAVVQHFCMFNTGYMTTRRFWKILQERLAPEFLLGVRRVQQVRQPNGNIRMDIFVEERVAAGLKTALKMTAQVRRKGTRVSPKYPLCKLADVWKPSKETKQWRLDEWRGWRDRHPDTDLEPRAFVYHKSPEQLATLNVNGLIKRQMEVSQFLETNEVGVLAIQETLMNGSKYRVSFPGYSIYENHCVGGFRGQALVVSKRYYSYRIDDGECPYIITTRVGFKKKEAPWYFFAVYLPSGGNFRSERTKTLKNVLTAYHKIMAKDKEAKVVILGDFNMRRSDLSKKLIGQRTGLETLAIRGSGLTFHRKGTKRSDIDSIVVNPFSKKDLVHGRVVRNWRNTSDHDPIITRLRKEGPELCEIFESTAGQRRRFDTDLIRGHSKTIVFSNKWSSLSEENIDTDKELDDAVKDFIETVNIIGIDTGVKKLVADGERKMPRKLKKAIDKQRRLQNEYLKAANNEISAAFNLYSEWQEAKKEAKAMTKKWKSEKWERETRQAAAALKRNESKELHKWEERVTKGGKPELQVTPLRGANGELITDETEIRKVAAKYYQDLNQDNSDLSKDKEYWKGKAGRPSNLELENINEELMWTEVLLGIRRLSIGTSPGEDEIPPEMYKAILKEECAAELLQRKVKLGDNINVALPAEDLPMDPLTPMGKQFFRIIKAIWERKRQPELWNSAVVRSLPKKGDPTDPTNYRGISLIAIGMKVVTTMVANRLSKALEENDILVPEQGGFRPGEEAVSQFVVLAEIVRRRRLAEKTTHVVFIDFMKAFDKVMHEALMEKLEANGIQGHLLELISAIYESSKAKVKVGQKASDLWDILRGVRQGCPLSPILFILFINDFLNYVPKGVEVPGIKGTKTHCPGLLFADDIAGLCNSVEDVKAFLAGTEKWSNQWELPTNASKCAVMHIGGDEDEQKTLLDTEFTLGGNRVPATRLYHYLGIDVTDKFGDIEMTDEIAHGKELAKRIRNAVNQRRAFLRDRKIPLAVKIAIINSKIVPKGIYGGEWIGMAQARTLPIQKEVNIAVRLALLSSSKNHIHASKPTSWELGIPSIEERMTNLRIRLWQKAPTMKTWMNIICGGDAFKGKTRHRVWTTQTSHQAKALVGKSKTASWIRDTLLSEGKILEFTKTKEVKNPPIKRGDTTNFGVRKDRELATLEVVKRAFDADLGGQRVVEATAQYVNCLFGRTREWVKHAASLYNLSDGTVELVNMRTQGYWTQQHRAQAVKAKGGRALDPSICVCCHEPIDQTLPEGMHILFDCQRWKEQRDKWLRPVMDLMAEKLVIQGTGTLPKKQWKLESYIRILGGEPYTEQVQEAMAKFKKTRLAPQNGDEDEESSEDDESGYDEKFWRLFTLCWGHKPEYLLPGFSSPVAFTVARFLADIMPERRRILFNIKEDETESLVDGLPALDGTPVKPPLTGRRRHGRYGCQPRLRSETISHFSVCGALVAPTHQADVPRDMARRYGKHAAGHPLYISDESSSEGSDDSAQNRILPMVF